MVGDEASAVFNEYLQTKMQKILEGLTEALLVQRPKQLEPFILQWLQKLESDSPAPNASSDSIEELKAARDRLAEEKNRLEAQLVVASTMPKARAMKATSSGSKAGSRAGSKDAASRAGSKESRRGYDGTSSFSLQQAGADGTQGSSFRPVSAHSQSSSHAEEERERRMIAKMQEKTRRRNVHSDTVTQEQIDNFEPPFFEKSPEAKQHLFEVIQSNDKLQVLFGHLTHDHIHKVIDAMFPREVAQDENLISQGEEGDNFYIVEEGNFNFFVERADGVKGKVMECGPGASFGELALMYNAPRAATVTAVGPAKVWGLDRESFRLMLCTAENTKARHHETFLEGVEILQDLTKYELVQLSDMLQSELWDEGEAILNQGDEGNYFYILEDGQAKAYIGGEKGEIEVKHYKRPGEYFGEIALLSSATRKATVRAAGTGCTTLSVCRQDFDSVLGPIKTILAKSIDKYPQYADFLREEEAKEKAEQAEQEKLSKMSDRSRRAGVSADSVSEEQMKNWKPPVYEKTSEAKERIIQTIQACDKAQVLFGHLNQEHLQTVVDAMFPKTASVGEALINQGEEGDNFYIVEDGSFDVFVQRGDEAAPGKVLEYGPGASFGELALMYNCKRAATVVATSPAKVWALDRQSFRLMLCTAENTKARQYEGFLENVDILKHLTKFELAQVSDLLASELFDAGEDIIKQGDTGNYFYILEDGQAKAYILGDKGEIEVKSYTTPGEYFGEIALITQGVRRATVRAVNDGCSVLSVERRDFDRVLGPIKEHLAMNIDKYPQYADVLKDALSS